MLTADQIRQFAFIHADSIDEYDDYDTYANVYKAFIAGYNKCLEIEDIRTDE